MSNRAFLTVLGEDAAHFLQGLITNDIKRADDGICYAGLLTPQGKYIADFFVLPHEGGYLIDAPEAMGEDLLRRLTMYKLRAKVELALTPGTVRLGTGTPPEGAVADPRDPAMGWRHYGASGDDGTDFSAIRVAQCIPESGIELTPDTYILEAGFERLNGVDFRKGCYVGQEVTARMRHKTELRKGLLVVEVEGAAPVGTPILASNGREAGTLYSQAGGRGIAQMRFDRIGPGLKAGEAAISARRD